MEAYLYYKVDMKTKWLLMLGRTMVSGSVVQPNRCNVTVFCIS